MKKIDLLINEDKWVSTAVYVKFNEIIGVVNELIDRENSRETKPACEHPRRIFAFSEDKLCPDCGDKLK